MTKHLETLSDAEVVEVVDQGLASLAGRLDDPSELDVDAALHAALDAWDYFISLYNY